MTDTLREAAIREKYRGLQGDMPPFGDVIFLLRQLDALRAGLNTPEPSSEQIRRIIEELERPHEAHTLARSLEQCWPLVKTALLAYRSTEASEDIVAVEQRIPAGALLHNPLVRLTDAGAASTEAMPEDLNKLPGDQCPACFWHPGHDPDEWYCEEAKLRGYTAPQPERMSDRTVSNTDPSPNQPAMRERARAVAIRINNLRFIKFPNEILDAITNEIAAALSAAHADFQNASDRADELQAEAAALREEVARLRELVTSTMKCGVEGCILSHREGFDAAREQAAELADHHFHEPNIAAAIRALQPHPTDDADR